MFSDKELVSKGLYPSKPKVSTIYSQKAKMKPTQIDPQKAEDMMYNVLKPEGFTGGTVFDVEKDETSIVVKIGLDAEETPQVSVNFEIKF